MPKIENISDSHAIVSVASDPTASFNHLIDETVEENDETYLKLNSLLREGTIPFFQATIKKNLELYAGTPVITSYQINLPKSSSAETFTIDIKCKFRWTDEPKMRIRIMALNALELPPSYREFPNAMVSTYHPPSLRQQTMSCLGYFFRSDMQSLLKNANDAHGIDNKERLYLQAYKRAHTDVQRIQVLESLINTLADFHQHLDKLWRQDFNTGERDFMQDVNLIKINRYLSQLPENYPLITPNAQILNDQFKSIFYLLKENHLEKAWALYKSIATPSYFIQRSFPNLVAMTHQLSAIFIIARLDKWYGPDIYRPEHEIIACVLTELQKACASLTKYNSEQVGILNEGAIKPIEQLIQTGLRAASTTSDERKRAIYDEDVKYNQQMADIGVDPSARILTENMDINDSQQIEYLL